MAYNTVHPLRDRYHQAYLVNISASPTKCYTPVAGQGTVIDAWVVISAAITVANAVVTVTVNGTTIGTITVLTAGSAVGSTYQIAMTGSESARTVKAGDYISFESDGGSTTTSIGMFMAVVRGP